MLLFRLLFKSLTHVTHTHPLFFRSLLKTYFIWFCGHILFMVAHDSIITKTKRSNVKNNVFKNQLHCIGKSAPNQRYLFQNAFRWILIEVAFVWKCVAFKLTTWKTCSWPLFSRPFFAVNKLLFPQLLHSPKFSTPFQMTTEQRLIDFTWNTNNFPLTRSINRI